MPTRRLFPIILCLACLAAAALAGAAGATEVAYVDGGQVWISTVDGAAKRSLSGPSPDAKVWSETAQAENGTVIGVRREPGKIGTLNSTRLWGPDGAQIGEGSLTAPTGRTSYAYPVTLGLSPDGSIVTYGYSNQIGIGIGASYEFGTYAEGSSAWYVQPYDVRSVKAGTLVGRRLVGIVSSGSATVAVQNPTGQPPYSEEFTPWLKGEELQRVAVSPSGTTAAVELIEGGLHRVAMIPFAGLGAPAPTDGSDCFLPVVGNATDVSFAPDGSSIAWHDDRGVVVAGPPVWFASPVESSCNLSRPPVVISATGRMPSLGNSTAALAGTAPVQAQPAPPAPVPPKKGGGGASDAPVLGGTLPKTVKAAALAKGLPLTVAVKKAGKVTATGKVGGALVATASARAKHPGKVKLRLKATKSWAGRLAQLAGKTLKISVKAPGGSLSLTRKLG
jgi:hypothetical protein